MNEQQIIERIQKIGHRRELDNELGKVHQMQDHIHAVRNGEAKATQGWFNTEKALFPEDFEHQMNELSAEVRSMDEILKQLDRIEAALNKRGEELKTNNG
jgi:hypothetical protein